jgi:5-methylcytosine-specific restriction enzyme subunit McrC
LRRLVVTEHSRIERQAGATGSAGPDATWLDGRLYDRLRASDRLNVEEGDRVFEWADGYARTTQWVGVVQVPGVQVEILPKVDTVALGAKPGVEEAHFEARRNLLYMLSVSGDVPMRSRDVARLMTRQAPLSETLSGIFADRLRRELLRGPERAYQEQEANLRCFKGKLLVSHQALRNAAHRERFYCRYDEFSDDTVLNRIFRASCGLLLQVTRTPATQDALRQCLLLLEGVADAEVQESDFGHVVLNRQNERFEDVLRFCRLLWSGRTPSVEAGRTRTFSLLFDMNKVFERFVVAFLRRYVAPRLAGVEFLPQAEHHKRHLMESGGAGVLRLEPDVLVHGPEGRLVMDTKWKLLAPGKGGRGGVAEADLYQLYAYMRRYGCTRSVLLYPFTEGLEPRDFDVLNSSGEVSGERVAVRMVHLHRDLHEERERRALVEELEAIVREGLQLPAASATLDVTAGSAA